MFFDDPLRLVCKANLQQASLAICRDSNDGSFWILNDDVQNCELQARELFGFNIGSFQELPTGDLFNICFLSKKMVSQSVTFVLYDNVPLTFPATLFIPLGDAASVTDQLPWLIQSDLDLVVLVSTGSVGNTRKEIMSISEVFCWITRTRGATEALMMDHNVSPMLKETGLTNHYT